MLSSKVFINFKEGKTISLVGVAAVLGQDIPEDEREWFLEAAWEEVVSASLESGMVSLSTSESSVLRMSPGIWRLLEVLCRPRFPWKLTIKIPDIFIIPGHQRHCIHHLYWREARVFIVDRVWVLYFQIWDGRLSDLKRTFGWPQGLLSGETGRGRWPPIEVSWLRPSCLINPINNLTGKFK